MWTKDPDPGPSDPKWPERPASDRYPQHCQWCMYGGGRHVFSPPPSPPILPFTPHPPFPHLLRLYWSYFWEQLNNLQGTLPTAQKNLTQIEPKYICVAPTKKFSNCALTIVFLVSTLSCHLPSRMQCRMIKEYRKQRGAVNEVIVYRGIMYRKSLQIVQSVYYVCKGQTIHHSIWVKDNVSSIIDTRNIRQEPPKQKGNQSK